MVFGEDFDPGESAVVYSRALFSWARVDVCPGGRCSSGKNLMLGVGPGAGPLGGAGIMARGGL